MFEHVSHFGILHFLARALDVVRTFFLKLYVDTMFANHSVFDVAYCPV